MAGRSWDPTPGVAGSPGGLSALRAGSCSRSVEGDAQKAGLDSCNVNAMSRLRTTGLWSVMDERRPYTQRTYKALTTQKRWYM